MKVTKIKNLKIGENIQNNNNKIKHYNTYQK